MSSKKLVLIKLSPSAIRELLQLPEDAEVTGVVADLGFRGAVTLRIEGAGYPTEDGELIREARGMICREFLPDGRELAPRITWKFSE